MEIVHDIVALPYIIPSCIVLTLVESGVIVRMPSLGAQPYNESEYDIKIIR